MARTRTSRSQSSSSTTEYTKPVHYLIASHLLKLLRRFPQGREVVALSEKEALVPLVAAARIGHEAILLVLRLLLRRGSLRECAVEGANMALFAAVERDCPSSIETLIVGAGADPFKCKYSVVLSGTATATHMAAARGKCKALACILRLDPQKRATNIIDGTGMAPVHVAAIFNQVDALRLLLRHNPSALTVRVHLEQGRKFLDEGEWGYGHVFMAAGDEWKAYQEREIEIIDTFRRYCHYYVIGPVTFKCGYDFLGSTATHLAAGVGNVLCIGEIARFAIESEYRPSITRLGSCHSISEVSMDQLEAEEEKPCLVRRSEEDDQALTQALHSLQMIEIAAWCEARNWKLSKGCMLEQHRLSDLARVTTPSAAMDSSTKKNPQDLRSARNVLEIANNSGLLPLHVAASRGWSNSINTLTSFGADVHAKGRDCLSSCLHHAAANGYFDLMENLVWDHNVPVDVRDAEGCTPLHRAVEVRCGDSIETLITLGADCTCRTYFDEVPLQLLPNSRPLPGPEFFLKLLLIHGPDPNLVFGWAAPSSTVKALAETENWLCLLYLIQWAKRNDHALCFDCPEGGPNAVLNRLVAYGAHLEIVQLLLKQGVDFSKPNNFGQSPILVAAQHGEPEVVELLLDAGGDANAKDSSGSSALFIAVESNPWVRVTDLLLQYGAAVDTSCPKFPHFTALCVAIVKSKVMWVDSLLRAGASVNVSALNSKSTPLHCAAVVGCYESAKLLLKRGPDINAKDKDGKTALHIAAEKCSGCSHQKIARRLLKEGADPLEKDTCGCAALHAAMQTGTVEIAQEFISTARRIDVQTHCGQTVLHFVARNVNGGAILPLLMNYDLDVNCADNDGDTPLHCATAAGHVNVVCKFLEHGADVHARNIKGEDALLLAARVGRPELLPSLLSYNAQFDSCNVRGENALHVAAAQGNTAVVRYLLRTAPAIIRESSSPSSLRLAAENDNGDIIRLLLEADDSALNDLAPKSVFSCESPCVSSLDLGTTAENCSKAELHPESEMDSSRLRCAICWRMVRNAEEIRKLPCSHAFHNACAVAWFCSDEGSVQLACPICRQRICSLVKEEQP